jgi:hypothetical protein
MSFTRVTDALSLTAASAVRQYVPVTLSGAEKVIPVGSVGQRVIGVTLASAAANGVVAVAHRPGDVVKCLAVATVTAGQRVAIASTNGGVGPIVASGIASGAPAAAPPRYAIGDSLVAAVAGDYFAVRLDPSQII